MAHTHPRARDESRLLERAYSIAAQQLQRTFPDLCPFQDLATSFLDYRLSLALREDDQSEDYMAVKPAPFSRIFERAAVYKRRKCTVARRRARFILREIAASIRDEGQRMREWLAEFVRTMQRRVLYNGASYEFTPCFADFSLGICHLVTGLPLQTTEEKLWEEQAGVFFPSKTYAPAPPKQMSRMAPCATARRVGLSRPLTSSCRSGEYHKGLVRSLGACCGQQSQRRSLSLAITGGSQTSLSGVRSYPERYVSFGTVVLEEQCGRSLFRQVDICVNQDIEGPVLLFDIRILPEPDQCFRIHDDLNVSQDSSLGALIQPGSKYTITIELALDSAKSGCHGVHSHYLLLGICDRPDGTYYNSDATASFDYTPVQGAQLRTFAIVRNIFANVALSSQEMALSADAKPFVPQHLVSSFDDRPQNTYTADPLILRLGTRLQPPQIRRGSYTGSDLGRGAVDVPPWLKLMHRLLRLERRAMDQQIKTFDLYHAHLKSHSRVPGVLIVAIEVPGLPEGRPSLIRGDKVLLRLSKDVSFIEVVAVVQQLRGSMCYLSLPFSSLFAAQLAHFANLNYPPWRDPEMAQTLLENIELCPFHVRFSYNTEFFDRMRWALEGAEQFSFIPLIRNVLSRINDPESIGGSQENGTSHAPQHEVELDSVRDARTLDPPIQLHNQAINHEQQEVIEKLLLGFGVANPLVLFGPPGTGKSVTVVEAILQVLRRIPGSRVCCCAPSNYATDLLVSGLARYGLDSSTMLRLNDPRRLGGIDSVKEDVRPFSLWDETTGLFEIPVSTSMFRVVACTCASSIILGAELGEDPSAMFTHVLIDEAGQALLPETLIPFYVGKEGSSHRLLAGDPKQLGPQVHSSVARAHGLGITMIQALMDGYANSGERHPCVVKLVKNYRSNAELLELSSRLFYENELEPYASSADIVPPAWDEIPQGRCMFFYGVNGQQMREGESPSYFNPQEASRVVELVKSILQCPDVETSDIGVMATYRQQVYKIRRLLRQAGLGDVRIGTVDDYQGQEERIVFISTVSTKRNQGRESPILRRNGEQSQASSFMQRSKVLDDALTFLNDEQRFNVAITRAKALLVVVGHPGVLVDDPLWSHVLRHCASRGAYRGVSASVLHAYGMGSTDAGTGARGEGGAEQQELDSAIQRVAQLSLLGAGYAETMYPSLPDELYDHTEEDCDFRVAL